MISLIGLGLLTFLAWYVCYYAYCFHFNLQQAKQSGIPYVVVPIYLLSTPWLVAHRLLIPILAKLPKSWTWWVDYCLPEFHRQYAMEIFERVGSDTFLTVSPGGLMVHTAEAPVIAQITTRRSDFPKPTHIYKSVDIYGKNVVTTEGHVWRQHRKATSPPFTEKNNHLVWTESIDLASDMLLSWLGHDGRGNVTIDRVMDDTMRLSLYVISRAGFGRKLKWPTADTKDEKDKYYFDPSKIKNEITDRDSGHTMSYTYAIHCVLDHLLYQFVFPRWMLKRAPINPFRKAHEAYSEWGNYMREAIAQKKHDIKTGNVDMTQQMDILGQLVKAQLETASSKNIPLSDSEILGNMFVLILAGHETAANSIHFSLIFLALFPQAQRALQKDLDRIFRGAPPSEWNYDTHLPQLFGGMVGAVLAEELRLIPPVPGIPKCTELGSSQPLMIDGKLCTVPANTSVTICASAVHRNPRYWPTGPSTLPGGRPAHPVSNVDNDLEEFKPERWLLDGSKDAINPIDANGNVYKDGIPTESITNDGMNVNESSDTSERQYKPVKGAYVPFSDGYRACLGRRFAQVEVLATLAVVLQNHSVELAVDKYATDGELISMSEESLVEVWQKAANDARYKMLNGLYTIITVQMRNGHVGLRFVPRGSERFPDDVDQKWKQIHPDQIRVGMEDGWQFWRYF